MKKLAIGFFTLAASLIMSVAVLAAPIASITFDDGEQVNDGISLTCMEPDGDGPIVIEGNTLMTTENQHSKNRYAYFAVDDDIMSDLPEGTTVKVEVELKDAVKARVLAQYDSNIASAPVNGAYADSKPVALTGTGNWVTLTFEFPNARFANHQNGNADFRLNVANIDLTIRKVSIVK